MESKEKYIDKIYFLECEVKRLRVENEILESEKGVLEFKFEAISKKGSETYELYSYFERKSTRLENQIKSLQAEIESLKSK